MSTRRVATVIVLALIAVGVIAYFASRDNQNGALESSQTVKWYGFNDGMELSRQQNKKVLIDVYTDWCGWCKKMEKEVYTDSRVSSALASDFVAIRLNAESKNTLTFNGEQIDEATFARAMGVNAYPTTIFLEPGAKPITKVEGYLEPQEFGTMLAFIGKDYYKTTTYEAFKSSGRATLN